MRKTLCLFWALCLLLTLLAGCSRSGSIPASGSEAGPEAPAETQTETPVQATETPVQTTEALSPVSGEVHPMLFRVTGPQGQEMYLFGTIHVGDARTAQVLELVAPTLDSCDALAVEFDIVAYESDTDAQLEDMMQFVLVDGTTAEDHMPAELYQRACELLEEAGLYPAMFRQFNLSFWSQTVEQAALMTTCTLDFNAGMDRQLIQHAYQQGLEVRDVESAAFQYGLLASFSDELNLLMIESVLDSLDTYNESTNRLYEAWLEGDYDHILAVIESDEASEDADYTPEELALVADYNNQMLDQRNLGMRDRAVEWLEAGDTVFFAVGTAHLVGDAGLVNLLRQAGYTVEQVQYAGEN